MSAFYKATFVNKKWASEWMFAAAAVAAAAV